MTRSTAEHRWQADLSPQPTVLAGVDLPERFGDGLGGEADLEELGRLVETAGGVVVGEVRQRRERPAPGTFLGKGKLEELRAVVAATGARLVVFDNELSPAQARNLEKALGGDGRDGAGGVSVLDRTELILDIFARHARTRQARLQVELAQLQYLLPRLRKLWSHLERQGGGIGTRGPGETQLETDRRLVDRRIAQLKRELAEIAASRRVQSRRRRNEYTVALVGYTNAGKSTLMRALTGADVLVEDQLFATLDATTRRVEVDEQRCFLLTDTVGFIRRLPHHLVESFRATLQEVSESDLLLHVVDAASPRRDEQIAAVDAVLRDLTPPDQPRLLVLNKIDRLDPDALAALRNRHAGRDDVVLVSALAPQGAAAVRSAVLERLRSTESVARLLLPVHRRDLVAAFHRTGSVLEESHGDDGCRLTVRLRPGELARLLRREPAVRRLD